jgi:hypothetical protein
MMVQFGSTQRIYLHVIQETRHFAAFLNGNGSQSLTHSDSTGYHAGLAMNDVVSVFFRISSQRPKSVHPPGETLSVRRIDSPTKIGSSGSQ